MEASIFYLNCQSLSVNKANHISAQYLKNSNCYFICLIEPWLHEQNINFNYFQNYNLSAGFCKTDHRGGGVAIWCKNIIECQTIDLKTYCVDKIVELCDVTFTINNLHYKIILCYRPPYTKRQYFDILYEKL